MNVTKVRDIMLSLFMHFLGYIESLLQQTIEN